MKKLILALSITLVAFSVNAQTDAYTKKMQQTLQLFDSSKTIQDFKEVSATFERIGDAEKNQWLPYYYAALSKITIGWMDNNADKDALADENLKLISKADALQPNNSEIYCLKNMVATQQMLVDPASRYMTYGATASEMLAKAKLADPTNPRPVYLEAATIFGTPEAFGGGKDKAKPVFEKAIKMFDAFKPASALNPTWGRKQAEAMLAQCK